jgi:hypothetical protein
MEIAWLRSRKSRKSEKVINGGFFALEPGVLDYIDADDTV